MIETPVQNKPPLEREELREVIILSLWAGQLLLQNGAPTATVEETVHRIGTGLGCNWMDVVVQAEAVIVTASNRGEFRTKARRVVRLGVDMSAVDAVNALSRRIWEDEVSRDEVWVELRYISDAGHIYGRWNVVLLVGLACAAFSRLFGGDLPTLFITFAASATAMTVRQELTRRHFNSLLVVIATAFVAGLVASSAAWFSDTPENALASAVLLLVPGVPLINAAEDLIEGYYTVGITRGVTGAVISLALALGLLIAMQLTGAGL